MRFRSVLKVSLVAAAFAAGSVALVGLPGAILFGLMQPVLWLGFGPDAWDRLPGDSLWPIALVISLLWPVSFVPGYLIAYGPTRPWRQATRIIIFLAVLAAWGLVLSVWCYMSAAR